MKNLIILGLAIFGGYVLYKKYSDGGEPLPTPLDKNAQLVASQPQQLSPIVTSFDPREDNVNQTWYVGPREILSTPLSDILDDLGLANGVSFAEEFETAPIV